MQIVARISAPTGYTRPTNEVHGEYPKWLHFDGKPSVLVESADEEAKIMGGASKDEVEAERPRAPVAPIPVLVGDNDELTMLKKIAEDNGIRIDGRWKLSKIRSAVQAVMPLPKE